MSSSAPATSSSKRARGTSGTTLTRAARRRAPLRALSVRRRVGGEVGNEPERQRLAREHRAPQAVRIDRPHVLGTRVDDEPRALAQLTLELARAPTRVAEVDARPFERRLHERGI